MPPGIDADRKVLFSKGDVGKILQILGIVESGDVVSFTQVRGDGVSAEMETKCGYMVTKMKDSEKEDESGMAHEEGGREGKLHGSICAAHG